MNIDKTKYQIKTQTPVVNRRQNQPNFTSSITLPPKNNAIIMSDAIKDYIPSAVNGMKKLSDNMGEVQNIIINALGTGLVAPIFIKWNPLSKTDEDTRTYSAWRQPVSAILTVLTQVGITIPFNKMIDRRANKGVYDVEYNKTLFQDKDYISKILKRQYPYATKNTIDNMVKKHMETQKASLLRMIKADNVVFSDDKGNSLPFEDKKFRKTALSVIDKQIKYQRDELEKCTDITIPKKILRGEYYRKHEAEARKIFNDINEKLNKTDNPQSIKKYIKELKKTYKNSDRELFAIFNDILARRGNTPADLKIAMQDKLAGILRDINLYTGFNSKEELVAGVENMEKNVRIKPIEDAIFGLKEARKKIENKTTIGEVEEYIKQLVGKDSKHRLADFKLSNKIAEAIDKMVKNNIKAHKQITGLIVSFLMLPVTCTLLNWSYPRFMDAVFPNLSNKKHPNEIKNLVDKANHKEVNA